MRTISITFYGGVNEIGGNKFLLEDGETRVFLDFGKNFAREKLYFEEPYIRAREEKHLLNLGILPHIKGLYKKDEETYELSGVLLSHPHLDHCDCLRFLKDSYPVFCGEDTKSVLLAREFSSQSIGADYNIANLTASRGEEVFKEFKTFKSGDRCSAGELEFQPYALDHSIPGAYGYIIETREGSIVYTGDFRMHGPARERTLEFLQRAKDAEPEVLLIEGTHIGECRVESEEEVKEKVGAVVAQTKKLVMAGLASADADRLKTFYEVAKQHGRKLAISTRQAYMLHTLSSHEELQLFSPADPNVLIFEKEKKQYRQYEKDIRKRYPDNIVRSADISHIQDKVILVASLYDMNEVAEIKPDVGSSYILSQSEPFDEEMEISYEKLLNWLDHFGVPLYQAHASGHATPHELKHAIAEISPKRVVPIHTQRPGLFKRFISDLGINVLIPSEGGRLEL
jgi:ribonuclease J